MILKKIHPIMVLVVVGCLAMAFVDIVLSPPYAVKSLLKILLFIGLPLLYTVKDPSIRFTHLFKINLTSLKHVLFLALGVYVLIIGTYFILGPFFDFTNVTNSLENNIGVTPRNFVFVALYVSLVNSLLEEFFFRGFAFLTLKKATSRKVAYGFSACAFALYHIGIMTSWFSIFLFILLIISLVAAGVLFNWLNEKNESIYASWFVHMFANFAINTIGFILFGIL